MEPVSKQALYDMDRLQLIVLVEKLQDEIDEMSMLLEEALVEIESK